MMSYSWLYVCETICFLPFGALLLFTWKLVILNKVYFKLPRKMSRMLSGATLPICLYKHGMFVCRLLCVLHQPKKNPTILSWNQLFKQDSKTSFYPPCLKGDFQQLYLYIAEEAVSFVSLCSHHLCPVQALSRMGGLWRKLHTVWVNVGGLHAGVFLLKRTANTFGQTPEDVYESRGADNAQEEKELS